MGSLGRNGGNGWLPQSGFVLTVPSFGRCGSAVPIYRELTRRYEKSRYCRPARYTKGKSQVELLDIVHT